MGAVYVVRSGQIVSDAVLAGTSQDVKSGGTAVGTTAWSRGRQDVSSGGAASGMVVSSGGWQTVWGTAFNTVIFSKGSQHVEPGGTASGTVISADGASQIVLVGGLASGTVIFDGEQFVGDFAGDYPCSGGTALDTKIYGGLQEVAPEGIVSGTSIFSGGGIWVASGGTALGLVQHSGGRISVDVASGTLVSGVNAEGGAMLCSGGTASGFIASGGSLSVFSAGTALGTVVASSAEQIVEGFASGTVVQNGGMQSVQSGGTASGTLVSSGGEDHVCSGGTALDAAVSSGGRQHLGAGGVALGTTVHAYGWQYVSSGGHASGTVVESRGGQYVLAGGMASGTVVESRGTLAVCSGGSVINASVHARGTLQLNDGAAVFKSAGGRLQLLSGIASGLAVGSGSRLDVKAECSASGAVYEPGAVGSISSGGADFGASAGGSLVVLAGGTGSGACILSGGLLNAAGTALAVSIASGGRMNVKSGGRASGVSIASGALLAVLSGGTASGVSAGGGGRAVFSAGAVLGGTAIFSGATVSGGTSASRAVLASGAALSACAGTNMNRLHLDARGASMAFSGTGNRLGSVLLDGRTALTLSVSGMAPGQKAPLLALSEPNVQLLGSFSVSAARLQVAGYYKLASGLVQTEASVWTLNVGSSAVQMRLDGTAVAAAGMTWKMKASGAQVVMTAAAKVGWMKRGNAKANTLAGSENCDVFWGGGGNDSIAGNGGRDVAVYGQEAWGQDRIEATDGMMTVLIKDLLPSDISSSLSGTDMTFQKRVDGTQKVVVHGWNSATHSVVFGGAMPAADAWIEAASPTLTQAKAARAEVWKAAGLAA